MTQAYKHSIVYFLLFSLLLLTSAAILFNDKIGFSQLAVLNYYRGDATLFIPAKTPMGILKIILPHIFAFGVFMMVLLHFLAFTQHKDTPQLAYIIYGSYTFAALELLSPFLILAGVSFFAYIKILSFFTLLCLQLYGSYLLFRSIIKEE